MKNEEISGYGARGELCELHYTVDEQRLRFFVEDGVGAYTGVVSIFVDPFPQWESIKDSFTIGEVTEGQRLQILKRLREHVLKEIHVYYQCKFVDCDGKVFVRIEDE
jgi:hypothetical protein